MTREQVTGYLNKGSVSMEEIPGMMAEFLAEKGLDSETISKMIEAVSNNPFALAQVLPVLSDYYVRKMGIFKLSDKKGKFIMAY